MQGFHGNIPELSGEVEDLVFSETLSHLVGTSEVSLVSYGTAVSQHSGIPGGHPSALSVTTIEETGLIAWMEKVGLLITKLWYIYLFQL